MRVLEFKHLPPERANDAGRSMAPGAGLVLAAAFSILLWAAIAGIIALF